MAAASLEKLAELVTQPLQGDPVPEGWYSIGQIAEMTGKDPRRVYDRLMSAHKAGQIERRRYRITGNKNKSWHFYYPNENKP